MRDALPELGVQARIAVNTGEVVTGTEERLATGDAVNVAARLEQAAQPGEVLIGDSTLQLVATAVETEPVEPLEVKGKAQPVPAHRLVSVRAEPERRHESRFVGREQELKALGGGWQRALDEERCELLTVVGDAGVGKSRLAIEFLSSLEARFVVGRCLPYGQGITYWPVVEVLKQLDALPSDPAAAASLRSLLGESNQGTSAEEIAWAFRKLLEEQAPLVCLFDDIQWGEETFLDLVEGVALLSSSAPVLLLCLARTPLTERRPQWPLALRLGPLPEAQVDELLPETLASELRAKISHAAGGNPLFVTEMVAMASESGGGVVVPPTLQALLAARLDQLERAERSVLERGAVEGEVFHRGAIQALSDNGQITPRLASLVRKGLLRPDKPQLSGDDAFRFRHLLIRDAAYDGLSKATRAELHERFADWLEERGQELVELDEILGFHLEQAAKYKAELGQPDPVLAERAGERLAAAGRRALFRDDPGVARTLLERAVALTRPLRLDVHLELDLAGAQLNLRQSAAICQAAAERAGAAGDTAGEALARVGAVFYRVLLGGDPDPLETVARAALPILEEANDHRGLVTVWFALSFGVANFRGRFAEMEQGAEQAIHHSRLAREGETRLSTLDMALVLGPRPADEALEALDALLPETPTPDSLLRRAQLLAMLQRFDEAWSIAHPAGDRQRELTGGAFGGDLQLGIIAGLEGDYESAARHLGRFYDALETHGQTAFLSTYAPWLGRYLCTLGREDEAEPLAQLGRELGDERDVVTQALWRQVQARVQAHRGEHGEAEALGREALSIMQGTDALNFQGDAFCDLAEVLTAAGRTDEAVEALEQALDRYERKKNLAMVAQVRPQLEALREEAPA
jgi:tetratricopeptide (TPR) repeat protein